MNFSTKPLQIWSAAAFLVLALLSAGPANACGCSGKATVQQSVTHAHAVFSGTVLSLRSTSDLRRYGIRTTGDTSRANWTPAQAASTVGRVKVDRVFKGKTESDIVYIITPATPGACGIIFKPGQRYIFYGTTNDETIAGRSVKRTSTGTGTYWTHACTRTERWSKAEEEQIVRSAK